LIERTDEGGEVRGDADIEAATVRGWAPKGSATRLPIPTIRGRQSRSQTAKKKMTPTLRL
jgi:hypothetical protein